MADSIDSILRQARASVKNLIDHIGPKGLPIACVKEILKGVSERSSFDCVQLDFREQVLIGAWKR